MAASSSSGASAAAAFSSGKSSFAAQWSLAEPCLVQVHARKRPMAADVDLMQIARDLPGLSGVLAQLLLEGQLISCRQLL